jgi:hypothetical protein
MPRVISKAKEYRANAAECRRRAECAKNAPDKRMWRDMSESWLGMGRHVCAFLASRLSKRVEQGTRR